MSAAELIELPPAETALQVYQTPKGLDPYIERVRREVLGQPVDLSTKKGREAIASRAFKVRKIKAALDGLGKEQVDRLKEIPKLIDAERKRMREAFDAMAEEVRRPLTEWEEAENLRVQKHRCNVDWFPGQVEFCRYEGAETIRAVLADIDAKHVDESWEEFEAEAHRAKARALDELTAHLAAREKHEAEQAELAELRRKQAEQEQKDREARIAQEAADKARADAEAKAQAERDAAAKREADAKAAAEQAEREKAQAIERQRQAEARAEAEKLAAERRAKDAAEAARVAEIKRQEAAQAAAAEAQRRREADTAHKASINNAALAAFVEHGMPEDCAKQAVKLIARGLIPAVRIQY
ncbi:Uncharacterised protein [Bordetella trematum]|uniref:hypothetical protein n=1 Tax=Bordetella trematum TaxID=123899 RepID=UPI00079AD458|nr:hypothetical protein [Bordetella trematum]SAI62947.1 Uncharacterised protein [Bordetella trematum]